MVAEYKDNEDFMQWAQQMVGDPTSIEVLPIPKIPKLPSGAPFNLPPLSTLTGALTLVPETIGATLVGMAKGQMSKVLADVWQGKLEKHQEDLLKDAEASTTPEEPAPDDENNEDNTNGNNEDNGDNGNDENEGGGEQENKDDTREYPVGAINRLNVNFLRLATKHLIFTNTWNKFFEKKWRERGDKMKKAMVAYHKKICKRFQMFELKYTLMQVAGPAVLIKAPITPLQKSGTG